MSAMGTSDQSPEVSGSDPNVTAQEMDMIGYVRNISRGLERKRQHTMDNFSLLQGYWQSLDRVHDPDANETRAPDNGALPSSLNPFAYSLISVTYDASSRRIDNLSYQNNWDRFKTFLAQIPGLVVRGVFNSRLLRPADCSSLTLGALVTYSTHPVPNLIIIRYLHNYHDQTAIKYIYIYYVNQPVNGCNTRPGYPNLTLVLVGSLLLIP
ncbi:hypothetical protein F5X99DRAFT_319520 [Biscogniauxia marginata]|nr:hypothetical protein F5X99DRAFT_319520 [Biscogniauxia marginata]